MTSFIIILFFGKIFDFLNISKHSSTLYLYVCENRTIKVLIMVLIIFKRRLVLFCSINAQNVRVWIRKNLTVLSFWDKNFLKVLIFRSTSSANLDFPLSKKELDSDKSLKIQSLSLIRQEAKPVQSHYTSQMVTSNKFEYQGKLMLTWLAWPYG